VKFTVLCLSTSLIAFGGWPTASSIRRGELQDGLASSRIKSAQPPPLTPARGSHINAVTGR
jgi:hypothetical protein